ncbi:hypothetical protein DL769_005864 [Monosporascus sp. CRB-8-3]|nr:hypothetical protein DL769_005864 [Monosporascus sp. CRB-8-3]
MLNHASTLSDENLFAATIILRMLEEMEGSTTGQDYHGHLLGIHAFVNIGDQYMIPGSLSAASFWVGLRQEIYIAVITQQPVKVNLDHFVVDRSFEPADDYTWSNRAIVHLADVLNFCFGEDPPSSSHWDALNEASEKWSLSRPTSFNPFFFRERVAPSAFPEVWHGSSCHVGDQFTERTDQGALMDLLKKTEADHARPTKAIQQQLMKAWGWIPDHDGSDE